MKSFYELITTPRLEMSIADQLCLIMYIGGFAICVFAVFVFATWVINVKQNRRNRGGL